MLLELVVSFGDVLVFGLFVVSVVQVVKLFESKKG